MLQGGGKIKGIHTYSQSSANSEPKVEVLEAIEKKNR